MRTGCNCRTLLRRRHERTRPRLLLERRHSRWWDRRGIKIPVISWLSCTRFDMTMNKKKNAMRIEPFRIVSLSGPSCQMWFAKNIHLNQLRTAAIYWSRGNDVGSTWLSSAKTLLIGYIFQLVFTARACDIIVTCTRPIFEGINEQRFQVQPQIPSAACY